jgi:hypothetical protein
MALVNDLLEPAGEGAFREHANFGLVMKYQKLLRRIILVAAQPDH